MLNLVISGVNLLLGLLNLGLVYMSFSWFNLIVGMFCIAVAFLPWTL